MNFRILVILLPISLTQAGPRSSASYAVPTDAADAGGRQAASVSYTNSCSLGGIAGISSIAAPAETAKAGYVAQLYELTGLTLSGSTPILNESATLQLSAWLVLDDATLQAAAATSVAWTVQSGPLVGVTTGGLVTAGTVYQNTAASVRAAFLGLSSTLGLTVLNTLPDNFGAYAGDGLDDSWQNLFFGLNNPNAAPTVDPDGDGLNNSGEFKSLTDPKDGASFFMPTSSIAGANLSISFPTVIGRIYTLEKSETLAPGSWTTTGLPPSLTGTGAVGTFTIPVDTPDRRFFRVQIGL